MDIKFRSNTLNSGTTFRSCIPARWVGSSCNWQLLPFFVLCKITVCVLCVSHSVILQLCNPMDCSPPGSSVHGVLQARILVWVAISFSRGSSPPRSGTWVSCIAGRFFDGLSHQGSLYYIYVSIIYIYILGCLHWNIKIAKKQFTVNISWISEVEI